jgi:hypothetical protein
MRHAESLRVGSTSAKASTSITGPYGSGCSSGPISSASEADRRFALLQASVVITSFTRYRQYSG